MFINCVGYSDPKEIFALDSLLDLIHPEEHQRAISSYENLFTKEQKTGVQIYQYKTKHGNFVDVLALDRIIEFQGEPALQVSVVNISQCYARQKHLLEIQNRYLELVEGSQQAILVHRNFKPLFCNLAYADLLGFKTVEEVDQLDSILPLIPETNHARAQLEYSQLMSGEVETYKYEAPGYNSNLEELRIMLSAKRVNWEGEQAVQVTAIDITEQYVLRQQIKYRATYDGLTQLLNRTSVSEKFENAVQESKFHDQPLSCVLIDIDNFKSINDKYGHSVGDAVLKEFSETCRSTLRQTDFIGRWGGEEFIIVFPRIDAKHAHNLADRLREKVASLSVEAEGNFISFTVSMGISSTIDGCFSIHKLVSRADRALYEAKSIGKNVVVTETLMPATGTLYN